MKLSIIVPCYNVERYLERCLLSLVHQDLDATQYEVIVVDDGATDGSGAIADRFAAQYPQLKVIRQKNQGVSGARNNGLMNSSGKYVFFVDSDDFIAENSLGYLLEIAEQHDLDTLAFNFKPVPEDAVLEPLTKDDESPVSVMSGAEFISTTNPPAMAWWYMVKRSILEREQLQFPVGHMLEDAAFTPAVFLCSERMARIDTVCYYYVQRGSSIMHSIDHDHCIKLLSDYCYAYGSMDAMIEKYKGKMDASALSRLRSRRNSYIYFAAARALRLGVLSDLYRMLKAEGMLPVGALDQRDFPGMKWKVMKVLINCPALMRALGSIYKLIKR
ncbi:MAG: glycosyltransferase [Bacteroidales bacterium]|nr:glycosyltransferase [Bacteroidales bacterium]